MIEEFLNPITDEKPCGEFLRYDPVYDEIKLAKYEDDPDLPQGVWQFDLKKSDWKKVEDLCTDVLKNRSKDLQIALWLTESWIEKNDWTGFNDGIRLLKGLCEKFWDNIYPPISNNNYEYRIAPFIVLSEKIPIMLSKIILSDPEDKLTSGRSLADWRMAKYLSQIGDQSGVSFKQIHESFEATNINVLRKNLELVNLAHDNLTDLKASLDNLAGDHVPSFRSLYNVFIESVDLLNKEISNIEKTKKLIKQDEEQQQQIEEIILPEKSLDNFENATISSAYEALSQIAKFLEENQPQSPAPVLLRLAERFGNKSFQDLLKEGNAEDNPLAHLVKLVKSQ